MGKKKGSKKKEEIKEELLEHLNKDELLKKGNKTVSEFKAFIAKGNIIDLAVGVVIGSAFGNIVSSIVNDIIMPVVGILIGGIDFSNQAFEVKDARITYGNFIQNVIDFLIIAICIFIFVKVINKITNKEEAKTPEPPKKDEKVALLEEIRDLLKENQKVK